MASSRAHVSARKPEAAGKRTTPIANVSVEISMVPDGRAHIRVVLAPQRQRLEDAFVGVQNVEHF